MLWRATVLSPSAPGRVVERVGPAGRRQHGEVDVQPRPDRRGIGAAEIRRPIAVGRGDLTGHLLRQHRPVGGVERRPVRHVDLELAGRELGQHALEVEAHLLGDVEVLQRQAGRIATEPDPVDPVRLAAGRAPPGGGLLVRLEQVQLELEAELRLEPDRPPPLDRPHERAPRADRQRPPVGAGQLADHHVGVGLPARAPAGDHRRRREVGIADVGRVPPDREDLAVDAHRQCRHGVVGVGVVAVDLAGRDVAPVGQPVEITPDRADPFVGHGAGS